MLKKTALFLQEGIPNDHDKTQLACEPKLVFEEYVTQPQRLCSQASIKFHEPQCERKAKAEEERKQR